MLAREHRDMPVSVLDKIAAAEGISPSSMNSARTVLERGTPSEIADVESGRVGLGTMYNTIRARAHGRVNGRALKNLYISPVGRMAAEMHAAEQAKKRPGGPKRPPTIERELGKLFVLSVVTPESAAEQLPAKYLTPLGKLIEWLIDVSYYLGEKTNG
jgi:hypothetical protein